MKVAVYYNNKDIRIEERPIPEINKGEVLVRVMASGICGSDVLEWYRVKKAPVVLGHEVTGEIIDIGEGVDGFKKGDRVFVSHHVPCNACHYCLNGHHTACEMLHKTNYDPGGFSEYIRVPRINVERGAFLLPDEISYDVGTLIEPLACVVRGQRLAGLKAGQSVLVIGSGISGLLHIKLARAMGAGRIVATDINDYRLGVATDFGADAVLNISEGSKEQLFRLNRDKPFDLVIVCVGVVSACTEAIDSVDRGGTVLFFAVPEPDIMVPLPLNDLWRNEITMMTSYGASPLDIVTAIELIRSKRVMLDDMITHRLSLDEIKVGFWLVSTANKSIKVIIKPHDERKET
ncbi:MAG: zinc-dependent dehydrogenase [Thermodesulfovibrionia bacterium]